MAAEVRAAATVVEAALRLVDVCGFVDLRGRVAIAAAKSEANRAAREVARSAHQLHGAIGFTDEHPLYRVTTRLWAWSQEEGADPDLHDELGYLVLEQASVWKLLVPVGPGTKLGGEDRP